MKHLARQHFLAGATPTELTSGEATTGEESFAMETVTKEMLTEEYSRMDLKTDITVVGLDSSLKLTTLRSNWLLCSTNSQAQYCCQPNYLAVASDQHHCRMVAQFENQKAHERSLNRLYSQ